MTVSSPPPPGDPPPEVFPSTSPDDITVDNTANHPTPAVNAPKIIDRHFFFQFSPNSQSDKLKIPSIHLQIIHEITIELENDIKIYSNSNKHFTDFSPTEWNHPMQHARHFKMQTSATKNGPSDRVNIIHRFQSTHSFHSIKNIPRVSALLRQHKVFLRKHEWNDTEWDIAQIGSLLNLDPTAYSSEDATLRVNTLLKNKSIKTMPPFKLVFSSPSIRLDGTTHRTKAYTLEVRRADIHEAKLALMKIYAKTTDFVFTKMKYSHPESYQRALHMQNQYLSRTTTIAIQHVPDAAMFYMRPSLLAFPSIQDVVKHHKHANRGKFLVITTKTHKKSITSWLRSQLTHIASQCPDDGEINFAQFPTAPCLSIDSNDVSSDGSEDTWISLSADSFSSIDIPDDTSKLSVDSAIPSTVSPSRKPPPTQTYASALQSSNPTSPKSPPTVSTEVLSSRELIKQYHAELEAERAARKAAEKSKDEAIANLTNQLLLLTNTVNQLISSSPATSTTGKRELDQELQTATPKRNDHKLTPTRITTQVDLPPDSEMNLLGALTTPVYKRTPLSFPEDTDSDFRSGP